MDTDLLFTEPLAPLRMVLIEHWKLGEKLVVGWTSIDAGLEVLFVPYDRIDEVLGDYEYTLVGARFMERETLARISRMFGVPPVVIDVPEDVLLWTERSDLESTIEPFAVCKTRERGAFLLDIVKFSVRSSLERVMLLKSMDSSINRAQQLLRDLDSTIDLRRSSTGDGFYVWNKTVGLEADVDLFIALILTLSFNGVARYKGRDNAIPHLRACYHVDSNYEFFFSESLQPGSAAHMTGKVTIELARMLDSALPGQILCGTFNHTGMGGELESNRIGSPAFVELVERRLAEMPPLDFGGERGTVTRFYLTGAKRDGERRTVKRYRIYDKHGLSRFAFNIRADLTLESSTPIYLGRADDDLDDFRAERAILELDD